MNGEEFLAAVLVGLAGGSGVTGLAMGYLRRYIDRKLEAGEDPFEAAKRELGEECGLTADHFTDLGVVYPTVGYDSERIYIWAATGLHPAAQHLDEDEFLDVVKMPLEKALALVLDGTIRDSKTQVGLMKYALLRGKA